MNGTQNQHGWEFTLTDPNQAGADINCKEFAHSLPVSIQRGKSKLWKTYYIEHPIEAVISNSTPKISSIVEIKRQTKKDKCAIMDPIPYWCNVKLNGRYPDKEKSNIPLTRRTSSSTSHHRSRNTRNIQET